MKWYTLPALALSLSLAGVGWALGRAVYHSQTYTPTIRHQAELAKQAKAPYDDVEMTNCGYQLEWLQKERGEKVVYNTPPFVRSW